MSGTTKHIEINKESGVKWTFNHIAIDVETGDEFLLDYPCTDSLVKTDYSTYNLKDTLVHQPIDDYGNTSKVNLKAYKHFIIWGVVINEPVNVYRFASKCGETAFVVELVFYSNTEALILFTYPDHSVETRMTKE